MAAIPLNRGDVYCHRSAGGGGAGPPHERDPARVLEDVLDGKVTVEAARTSYGVVLALQPPAVDEAATQSLREGMGR